LSREECFYDAIAISNQFNIQQTKRPPELIPSDNVGVLALLKNYFKQGADIPSEIDTNPFFKRLFLPLEELLH